MSALEPTLQNVSLGKGEGKGGKVWAVRVCVLGWVNPFSDPRADLLSQLQVAVH